ncbi:hypothetical protein Tco_1107891 [Tanacetum coccineum]
MHMRNGYMLEHSMPILRHMADEANFAYPTYEPPNVPPYPYPYMPYPHPYTHYPDMGNLSYGGGQYGAPGDAYLFTGAMPNYGGNLIIPSLGYEVGGSSRGVQDNDDDDDMSDQFMSHIMNSDGNENPKRDLINDPIIRIPAQADVVNKENAMGESSGKEKVVSFASMLQNRPAKKIVKVIELRNSEQVQGAAVAIPLEAVKEGKSDYAKAFIEVAANKELLNSVVVVIPFLDGTIGGIHLSKAPPNMYYHRIEKGATSTAKEVNDEDASGWSDETQWIHAKQAFNVINESDSEEVDQVIELEKPYGKNGTDGTSTNPEGASTPVDEQSEVRYVIHENNLSLFAILESHVASSRLDLLCSRIFRHWTWTSNGTRCSKGTHIIIGWNSNMADVSVIAQSDQAMHFVRNRPWCILGDFNAAFNLEDSTAGSSRIDISMREFKECVEEIEVMDVARSGLQFTWNQKPRGDDGILKKIDRVMANLEFNDNFIGAHAIFQPYRVSDHAPAVLKIPLLAKLEQRPFKFTNILVVRKLKMLKKPLRKMLYDHGNLHENVKKLRFELDQVQKDLGADPYNSTLREEEAIYVQAFNDALIMEERFLKQKAKIEWLKVGDSNTAYFHKAVKSRVSKSQIEVVMDSNGVMLADGSVADGFVNHYESFLGQPGHTGEFNMDGLFLNTLEARAALNMVRAVTVQEVKEAIFSMENDKSPGPDGYTAAFFKEAWEFIANDVIKAVQEFFRNGNLLKELNHTIIALIPKVSTPTRTNDYRLISCCNVLFKVISKIISNRIKGSLNGLISPNQSTFVPGRRISDNILLMQELMHNYHLDRGTPRCAFKVDIQKAYDTVD